MVQSKLFEQPKIYIVFYLFTLLIYLLNKGFFKDETLETTVIVLLILTIASHAIWTSFRTRLKINTIRRNTGTAIFMAIVMIGIIFVISSVVGLALGFADKFLVANSIAMIGAFPPLLILDHQFLTALIFIVLIPIIETVTVINIADLTLSTFKSKYTLKDPKVHVVGALIGIGAIFYHIYAKFIPVTMELNIHALLIVFTLFYLIVIFAVKTKEMETPIYGHIGNNGIAMWQFLKEAIRFV